jgi:hypothetical protein
VGVRSGNPITAGDVETLVADALRIAAVLGCRGVEPVCKGAVG